MTFGVREVLLIIAIVLFLLDAWPGAAKWPLLPVGLAFLAGGLLAGGA